MRLAELATLWLMIVRPTMRFGLIGSPGWRSCGRHGCTPGRESVRFAQSQVADNSPPMCIQARSAAALPNRSDCCRISPCSGPTAQHRAGTVVRAARHLQPTSCGELSERVAETVVAETRHLDRSTAAGSMST